MVKKRKGVILKMDKISITYEEGQRLTAIKDNASADLGITLTMEQVAEMVMRKAIREADLPES